MSLDGVLVVDKPAGITSHDVVDEVRRRLRTRRVGHAGTLDPDATGVLVVGVGKATRLLPYSQSQPKCYRAEAVFGVTTTTQDASGEVVEERDVGDLAREEVALALKGFLGEIEQIPPMVSAVKVGGERLYRKARRGEEVERAPRRVTIHSLELLELVADDRPRAAIDVCCSSGTYIRTLVHDLGQRLGCGAHLAALRRTHAGGFSEQDAVPLAELAPEHLVPLARMLPFLPVIEVDEEAASKIANGVRLPAPGAAVPVEDGGLVALAKDGTLLALYCRQRDELVAERVVPQ